MNGRRILFVVLVLLVAAIMVILYNKSRAVSAEAHTAAIGAVLELKRLDAMLNLDILEIRYRTQLNLDAIAEHAHLIIQQIDAIHHRREFTHGAMKPVFTDMKQVFNEKIDLIERFKAHNSVLNNSLKYLPKAAELAAASVDSYQFLRVDAILFQLLRHVMTPDSSHDDDQALLSLIPSAAGMEHLREHAAAILSEHKVVSGMMNRLLEIPSDAAVNRLFDAYKRDYQHRMLSAQQFQVALIIFIVMLIFYVVVLFFRLRSASDRMCRLNQELNFQKQALDEHAIVAETDAQGRITYTNSKFREISGFSEDELIGSSHKLVNSGYHSQAFFAEMWARISSGKVWRGEVFNQAKGGAGYWVDTTIVPFLDARGIPFKYIAVRTDITRQKLVQHELEQEHRLLERVFTTIPSLLIGVDGEGDVTIWNAAAERLFGLPESDAVGRPLVDLPIQWEWLEVDQALVSCRNKGSSALDNLNYKRPDGSAGFLGISLISLLEKGQDKGFLLIGTDTTERIRLQSKVQLAQKMEAVGELAAGIAHEINTPLQYAGDNIRFLREAFGDLIKLRGRYVSLRKQCDAQDFAAEACLGLIAAEKEVDIDFLIEEIPAAVDQSLDGLNKAGRIVGAMKEFSHPGQKDKVPTDINRMLDSTITVARNEWKYVAEVEKNLECNMPLVTCLPELNQVFLNMIVNAAHAIEARFGRDAEVQGVIRISTWHETGEVIIRISDNGCGIAPEHQQKVFQPFFTTKEIGKGTGQGLAISHAIVVEQLGGSIELDSKPGDGSSFTIRLPMHEGRRA